MYNLSDLKSGASGDLVVVGAGNWGTTLARLLAPHRRTRLWTRTAQHAEAILGTGENQKYLPGLRLPPELVVEPFGASAPKPEDLILIAVPSHQVRAVAEQLLPIWEGQIIVNTAKGYEHHSMKTLSQVIQELLPAAQLVVWSGPNIAGELAVGKPTRAVLAGRDMAVLTRAVRMLRNGQVSFEISRDVRGVELCASLKGIIAITIGLADGLELGDNFIGLLVAYGLREFAAVAEFMGIAKDTIYGIAGLGDCVTSSLSPSGRNRRFGKLVGQGMPSEQAVQEVGMVVEGVQMLLTITELEDLSVPTPLFSAVKKIVFGHNGDHRELLVNTVMNYSIHYPKREYAFGEAV